MSILTRVFSKLVRDIATFSQLGSKIELRSYQKQVCDAILKSIKRKDGMTFVVVFPRQSGKNEVQAQLEAYLLAKLYRRQVEIVKVAPTWIPQARVSMFRLRRVLETNSMTLGRWCSEAGYIYRLGSARITFLSGSPTSNVVGATASLLLECDEAQSVLPSKWDKDFAPMAASANTTTVFWGTSWTSKTLLAREMRLAQLQEAQDGLQRVFLLNADQVAAEVPDYGRHVASQVARLGRDHPLIKTQYFSEEIDSQIGMFPAGRQALMQGEHPPQQRPTPGQIYALLVDVAGEDENALDPAAANLKQVENKSRDATALTVVQVDTSTLSDPVLCAPTYLVVNRCLWSGVAHSALYGQIKALVEMWKAHYVVIDATGIGAGLSSFLEKAFPTRVIAITFSSKTKSELGWRFLAIVETGRYKEYASPLSHLGGVTGGRGVREKDSSRLLTLQSLVYRQVQHCQSTVLDGPGRIMRWGVPANTRDADSGELVHDDLLISASLCSFLDLQDWGTAESGVIRPLDPLEGMGDVF